MVPITILFFGYIEEDGRLLEQSLTEAQTQCQSAVEAALSTIMAPVSSQLVTLPELPAWTSRPGTSAQLSSSFSPQEYITQVSLCIWWPVEVSMSLPVASTLSSPAPSLLG